MSSMQFVRVSIGNSVSVHDVKFYACTKAEPIKAEILGNSDSWTRLTSSRHWNKHYAYFPTNAAPADKVGYIELTFDEYTELATKKAILKIEIAERPANYAKRLTGYFTRIENPESPVAIPETANSEIPNSESENSGEPKPIRPARRVKA